DINTDKVKTTGTQEYAGAVTLTADTNLTGTSVKFDSTINGAHALTVTGNGTFGGEVGQTTNLASLHVTGTSAINTDKITTTGAQAYAGAVTLAADSNLKGTSVTFGSTVNGAHALTVTGNGTFGGEVGQTTNLASLHVTGTSAINTDKITTTGTQAYDG